MEAKDKLEKIKKLIFICLAVSVLEMVFGLTIMYSGMMYEEFEEENAREMLNIIQESNVEYYEKLVSTSDGSYMEEFEKMYTTKGKKSLTVSGILMSIFSLFSIIPVLVIFFIVKEKKEEPIQEESSEEEEEGSEEGEESPAEGEESPPEEEKASK